MLLIHDVCTFIQIIFFILTYLINIFTTRHICIFIFISIFFSLHVPLLFIMCVYVRFFFTCMHLLYYGLLPEIKQYYYYYNVDYY